MRWTREELVVDGLVPGMPQSHPCFLLPTVMPSAGSRRAGPCPHVQSEVKSKATVSMIETHIPCLLEKLKRTIYFACIFPFVNCFCSFSSLFPFLFSQTVAGNLSTECVT